MISMIIAYSGSRTGQSQLVISPYNTALGALHKQGKALKGREIEQRAANVQMSPANRSRV